MISLLSPVRQLSALVIALALSGCASYSGSSLTPGASSQADVRAAMGAPAAVHPASANASFSESWEYPRGPIGRHTYMARFDRSGKLVAIDQVLTVATVARIRMGQDGREDVARLLGRPGQVFPLRDGGEAWDYAAYAEGGQMRKIRIVVNFDKAGRAIAGGESYDVEEWSPISDGGTQ
jgi:outer membrane protein assembly factor BamE (lipoprotein component of BamABCDE complex)